MLKKILLSVVIFSLNCSDNKYQIIEMGRTSNASLSNATTVAEPSLVASPLETKKQQIKILKSLITDYRNGISDSEEGLKQFMSRTVLDQQKINKVLIKSVAKAHDEHPEKCAVYYGMGCFVGSEALDLVPCSGTLGNLSKATSWFMKMSAASVFLGAGSRAAASMNRDSKLNKLLKKETNEPIS